MVNLLDEGQQEFIVDKGARWFLKEGADTSFLRGFTSKEYASLWIESLGRKVDWRAGFTFRLRDGNSDLSIVNRTGKLAKN
jgi:hypothetical protein